MVCAIRVLHSETHGTCQAYKFVTNFSHFVLCITLRTMLKSFTEKPTFEYMTGSHICVTRFEKAWLPHNYKYLEMSILII